MNGDLHKAVPVSAIVTAFQRPEMTANTVRCLQHCRPPPAEILVHVDDNRSALVEQLRASFPDIQVLFSTGRVGPGGARNQLLRSAGEELVASFDDDSHPMNGDFFQGVIEVAAACPNAAVFTATLLESSGDAPSAPKHMTRVATFAGGACVYRRSIFLQTEGYVPLPLAYGMEEVDLSLRLHAMGHRIMHAPQLRVVHEVTPLKRVRRIVFQGLWPQITTAHDPGHRDTSEISTGTVANLALLFFLRYPLILWPYGMAQCLHKALELAVNGRSRDALAGLCRVPSYLWRHRRHRAPLTLRQVWSYLRFRRGEKQEQRSHESS